MAVADVIRRVVIERVLHLVAREELEWPSRPTADRLAGQRAVSRPASTPSAVLWLSIRGPSADANAAIVGSCRFRSAPFDNGVRPNRRSDRDEVSDAHQAPRE